VQQLHPLAGGKGADVVQKSRQKDVPLLLTLRPKLWAIR
jgi:hypothetical protein